MSIKSVSTSPFEGQKPGTSGLRKKTKVFVQEHYLENFIQSTFDALGEDNIKGATLCVAGDGRYYNKQAIATIAKMAAANGFAKIVTGVDGLMSTPCVSDVIRKLKLFGGIILTASHNPGGIEEDFGVKYNCENGGPAPEKVTNAIFDITKSISEYKIWSEEPVFDLATVGSYSCGPLEFEVIDAAAMYVDLMKSIFDFNALKTFVSRSDFSMLYDCMHGVAGPFAKEIVIKELGLPASSCVNADPKEDFGGGHPDPNLTYAHDLVASMGLDAKHPIAEGSPVPTFGAAADGDADRNMILGDRFFVTPSDSVAIIAAYATEAIPYFKTGGVKGVARSMPTSAALDRVAAKLGFTCFEVPTGWKFFGNLMDAGKLSICGEESFGTGSDHIREKDGAWAVLCWLSILEFVNRGSEKLVSIKEVVEKHWGTYGRNYYSRYDYENCEKEGAVKLMTHLVSLTEKYSSEPTTLGGYTIDKADEFCYNDPVDGSVSAHQGIRFIFTDGSRIIFRLSGTGSVGATIRLYVEQYNESDFSMETQAAVKDLIGIALELSKMEEFTGRTAPTVIT